jgi:hypothetical protein
MVMTTVMIKIVIIACSEPVWQAGIQIFGRRDSSISTIITWDTFIGIARILLNPILSSTKSNLVQMLRVRYIQPVLSSEFCFTA